MDLTTHQAQATNHTRPDTTPIHAQANTIHARSDTTPEAMHARLGTTPEANLQEGQSDTTPEAMHARLGTTPEANLQEGQSRLATASKGSRMANALDTRPDACRRTIEEIKADLDKNLAARIPPVRGGRPTCQTRPTGRLSRRGVMRTFNLRPSSRTSRNLASSEVWSIGSQGSQRGSHLRGRVDPWMMKSNQQ